MAAVVDDSRIPLYFLLLLTGFIVFVGGCSSFRPKTDPSPAARMEIVSIAMQYKGTPYKWRGNTPDGFDCGGYVQFVFKQAGFDIPRTSSQQFEYGYKVARSNLRKGDLVFFTRWKLLKVLFSPSHVGIYIGEKRFIHAPSSGKSVRINSLDNIYWRTHYKGAGNLLY